MVASQLGSSDSVTAEWPVAEWPVNRQERGYAAISRLESSMRDLP
jgi:hypothetical protein